MSLTRTRTAASLLLVTALASGAGTPACPQSADRHGAPLPAGAVARLGTLRFRLALRVDCAALSRDGRQVAAGGNITVRVWDAATGKELHRLAVPNTFSS